MSAPDGPAAPPPAIPPLEGSARLWGTLSLSLATFMNVLDSSIANVSVPSIAGDLGVSPSQGTWIITSFAVSNAIAVPLTGWLAQRFGAVRLFVASVLLFVLASALCGLAPSLRALVAFRILQGMVAGPMIPLSQALLMSSYPPAKVGTALALWSMTTLVAPVAGPLLGGWITDHVGWEWIFFINIPVGLWAAAVSWAIYRPRETPTRRLPIDRVGLALLVLGVGSFQVMLDKGKELDWFQSPAIVALGVVSLVTLAFFLAWELTEEHPVVDLRLMARRNFVVGVASVSVGYAMFFGSLVVLPLWLQQYMGYTATDAGLTMAPVGLLAVPLLPVVGRLIGRVDPRWLASFAFLTYGLVMSMRAVFTPQTDIVTILLPTVIQGVAVAFFFVPLTSLTMSGLTPDRIPAASGLSNFARITAGAFGTSIGTTLWEDRAALHHAHLVEQLGGATSPAFADAWRRLASAGLGDEQVLLALNRMIDQQAYTRAADDVFLGAAWVFVSLVLLVMLGRPTRRAAPPAAAGEG